MKGAKITVLGLSYKPGVSDDRESPAYELIELLRAKKADLTLYDPYLPEKSSVSTMDDALNNCTCAVIVTAHKEFLNHDLYKDVKLIVDGRNCLEKEKISDSIVIQRNRNISIK